MRVLVVALGALSACATSKLSTPPVAQPSGVAATSEPEPEPEAIPIAGLEGASRVRFEERVEATDQGPMRVWLYTPDPMPDEPGCIVVPPAGSNLISGKRLAPGDRPEHEPYARAGYVVVAFDIAGEFSQEASDAQVVEAIDAFQAADGGVANARRALDIALTAYPSIDTARLFAAGHSSAGTVALMHAALDDRIDGVIAFSASTDVVASLTQATVDDLDAGLSGFEAFVKANSPIRHANRLSALPVFLFHAEDDEVVPPSQTKALMDAMTDRHERSKRVVVASGGHYDAMIREGIPLALEWLAQP